MYPCGPFSFTTVLGHSCEVLRFLFGKVRLWVLVTWGMKMTWLYIPTQRSMASTLGAPPNGLGKGFLPLKACAPIAPHTHPPVAVLASTGPASIPGGPLCVVVSSLWPSASVLCPCSDSWAPKPAAAGTQSAGPGRSAHTRRSLGTGSTGGGLT